MHLTSNWRLPIFFAGVLSLQVMCKGDEPEISDRTIKFDRDVRPILSDNCYYCHGPDANQRESSLRLDNKDGAFEDLGGHRAIIPGKPDESELIRRIYADDPGEIMPPPHHRKKLSDQQKRILTDWVLQGANWEDHWSFVSPRRSRPPLVQDTAWPVNAIDRFVLAKLESKEIKPSPEAPAHQLLRRLCFDLNGLPPTSAQASGFLPDEPGNSIAPGGYERVVDDLLNSRHFGERMAVYWLDLVRYADTVGYHGDQPISVSPYRDYVIDAFNTNMPFNRFTREQLAGDLHPNPTQSQLVASGYNRLGMMSAEGGVQPKEYLAKYAADRVRTAASVWLGITLACAECHDHKFDPLSTRDFYRFAAFFADIKEKGLYEGAHQSGDWGPAIDVVSPELVDLLTPVDEQIERLRSRLKDNPVIAAQRRAWEAAVKERKFKWHVLRPIKFEAYPTVAAKILEDNSILLRGDRPNENAYVVAVENTVGSPTGFRLEALPDKSLPKGGPGRAANGNFVVTELSVLRGNQTDGVAELKKVVHLWPKQIKELAISLRLATATVEQDHGGNKHPDKKWSAASAIDRDQRGTVWGWAILPDAGKANELVVQTDGGQDISTRDELTFVIHQYHGQGGHTLGRFRLSATADAQPTADPFRSLPDDMREAVLVDPYWRTEDQQTTVREYYVTIAPAFKETHQRLMELERQRQEIIAKNTRSSLITVSVAPRETRVFPRGNWMDDSGERVSPGVPDCFKQIQGNERLTRLDLANWIVAPDNPLASRVLVNRLWKMFFGNGLSNVLDDLGSQGEPPTHPALLDYLAVELIESNWDIKHIVKLMVTSRTYRQSSRLRKELQELDPHNRLYARQSSSRLDAEFVRDNALATAGLLNRQIGGGSVKPYQPAGLYRHLNFPARKYVADAGQNQYRRGLYTHWQRQYLHPAMKTLDAPSREECTAARPTSNTPLAALLLLNDPSYVEAARAFATRAIEHADSAPSRIEWMFVTALTRKPRPSESKVISELVASHRDHYTRNRDSAMQLLSVGQLPAPIGIDSAELAAWTSAARAIMNMHEFVTRN